MMRPAVVSAFVAAVLTSFAFLATTAAAADGDVNCDSRVDSIDASLLLQVASGLLSSPPCASKADVNSDGSVDSIDALFILQYNAGLLTAFPTCDITVGPSTAQSTIDAAMTGQTICLRSGTYRGLFVFGKTDLRIYGSGTSSTVVNEVPDSDWCVFVGESRSIEMSDLHARSCDGQAAFANDSTDVTFRRMEGSGSTFGFQYQNSTGRIEDSRAHDNGDFGLLVQNDSNVTSDDSTFERNDIGVLNQNGSTLRLSDSVVRDNSGGGVFTLQQTGHTVIEGASIDGNGLSVFAGVPGCADLPPADPNPPQCFLDNLDRYRSDIRIEMNASTVRNSGGPGVVLFPGVTATITRTSISNAQLTGLFAWGAYLTAAGNEYDNNVENAVECRAYPGPSSGDRGMCDLAYEHMHDSRPLAGNRLGGGFVSEGGAFRMVSSLVEDNWGIGVQVVHQGTGTVSGSTIRNNGGTAFCVSAESSLETSSNTESGNRPGSCLGHP